MLGEKKIKLENLEEDIKRRNLSSSHEVAEKITKFFYQMSEQDSFGNASDLLEAVKCIGKQLERADSLNFVVPNTVKRILHIIREA